MKKFSLLIILIAIASIVSHTAAQNYLINFTGTGEATTVDAVYAENLATGAKVNLSGSDILRLTGIVGISQVMDNNSSEMRIYPNPMNDYSTIVFFAPAEGDAVITIYEMTGKPLSQVNSYLERAKQQFRLSGIKKGLYLINVTGSSYQFSGKLLCNGKGNGILRIEKDNSSNVSVTGKATQKNYSESKEIVDMQYAEGQRLKFIAVSGIYSTVKTDIPKQDKELNFNFISCTDGDNNNYPVLEIGSQIWMAQNLKTTRYSNGDLIATTNPANLDVSTETTPKYQWAYNGNEGRVATYGRLYSGYAVNDSRNICPADWHVPTDEEWTVLTNFLGGEYYAGGKLKETGFSHWSMPNTSATNETGFTALPGGYRSDFGDYYSIGAYANWWSSSEIDSYDAWSRVILFDYSDVLKSSYWQVGGSSVRCLTTSKLPILTTSLPTSVIQTTATSGGVITSEGITPVTVRGICWSKNSNPTTSDNKTTDGEGPGVYTSSITGLDANSTYYVRAYATNSLGTSYGNEISFKTPSAGTTVTDLSGNGYNTVTIGTQTWMAENLKTTKYNDNSDILLVEDAEAWAGFSKPAYCWYDNEEANNKATYGALYNWYTVNTGKLCPTGWHVPTDSEWKTLEMYLGMTQQQADATEWRETDQGTQLKNISGWNSGENGTNTSGFSALPGGSRYYYGMFADIGYSGSWWSSIENDSNNAWFRSLSNFFGYVNRYNSDKRNGFSVRCLMGEPVTILPEITTRTISGPTQTTAISGGEVITEGGANVTARGICWSTATNPTIENNITNDGSGPGIFTSLMTGLTPATTYYVRAYATSIAGTAYGNELKFKTYTGIVSDASGNVYNTVTIGAQIWMAENLKTTKYSDNSDIPLVEDLEIWVELPTPAYCWYNNEEAIYKATYGALYNWYAVNTGKLCPTSWHVPTDEEWKTLEMYLGMTQEQADAVGGRGTDQGTQLISTTGWSYGIGTNTSGFSALPGGYRNDNGNFYQIGYNATWWSSTETGARGAWYRDVQSHNGIVSRYGTIKHIGFSVRCLMDSK